MTRFTADRLSLSPALKPTRRAVLVTGLAIGFASVVQPVAAQTVITTDTVGLTAGEIKIPVDGGTIPGYRAMPDKGGPFPVVLVVQEIFGVHEHIRDVCRRLAKLGLMAIAPELYARQGDVSKLTAMEEIFAVVKTVPDAQVMADLDATVAFAKASGVGDTARLAITGFCWGGRITWLYAAHNPGLKAGIAWYGKLVGEAGPLTPRHPVDVAKNLNAPVLGLYGGADQGIPLESIEKMQAACTAGAKTCEIVVYPDTPHAFHADYRPSYREGPAKDGWAKLIDWLKKNGVS